MALRSLRRRAFDIDPYGEEDSENFRRGEEKSKRKNNIFRRKGKKTSQTSGRKGSRKGKTASEAKKRKKRFRNRRGSGKSKRIVQENTRGNFRKGKKNIIVNRKRKYVKPEYVSPPPPPPPQFIPSYIRRIEYKIFLKFYNERHINNSQHVVGRMNFSGFNGIQSKTNIKNLGFTTPKKVRQRQGMYPRPEFFTPTKSEQKGLIKYVYGLSFDEIWEQEQKRRIIQTGRIFFDIERTLPTSRARIIRSELLKKGNKDKNNALIFPENPTGREITTAYYEELNFDHFVGNYRNNNVFIGSKKEKNFLISATNASGDFICSYFRNLRRYVDENPADIISVFNNITGNDRNEEIKLAILMERCFKEGLKPGYINELNEFKGFRNITNTKAGIAHKENLHVRFKSIIFLLLMEVVRRPKYYQELNDIFGCIVGNNENERLRLANFIRQQCEGGKLRRNYIKELEKFGAFKKNLAFVKRNKRKKWLTDINKRFKKVLKGIIKNKPLRPDINWQINYLDYVYNLYDGPLLSKEFVLYSLSRKFKALKRGICSFRDVLHRDSDNSFFASIIKTKTNEDFNEMLKREHLFDLACSSHSNEILMKIEKFNQRPILSQRYLHLEYRDFLASENRPETPGTPSAYFTVKKSRSELLSPMPQAKRISRNDENSLDLQNMHMKNKRTNRRRTDRTVYEKNESKLPENTPRETSDENYSLSGRKRDRFITRMDIIDLVGDGDKYSKESSIAERVVRRKRRKLNDENQQGENTFQLHVNEHGDTGRKLFVNSDENFLNENTESTNKEKMTDEDSEIDERVVFDFQKATNGNPGIFNSFFNASADKKQSLFQQDSFSTGSYVNDDEDDEDDEDLLDDRDDELYFHNQNRLNLFTPMISRENNDGFRSGSRRKKKKKGSGGQQIKGYHF